MKLKDLMKQKRWSCITLGKEIGRHRGTVWNWATGRNEPSISEAMRLAEILEVPVEEVLKCFEKNGQAER